MKKSEVYLLQEVFYKGMLCRVVGFNWAVSDEVKLENLDIGTPAVAWCGDLVPTTHSPKEEVDVELFKDIYKILIKEGERRMDGSNSNPKMIAFAAEEYYNAGREVLEDLVAKSYLNK